MICVLAWLDGLQHLNWYEHFVGITPDDFASCFFKQKWKCENCGFLKSTLISTGSSQTRRFSCGGVFESCFVMKHLEVILLKVKHIVFPCFWSGFSPNIAEVSLTASKTELSYYWLSDKNMTVCSKSSVHVVKPFQMLKLQLLETD